MFLFQIPHTVKKKCMSTPKEMAAELSPRFMCKPTLNILLKQLEFNFSNCYCGSYSPDKYDRREHSF